MSINLTTLAVTEFDAMVKQAYQAAGFKLKDTVRLRTDVVGNQVRFQKMAEGLAQQKAIQDDVVPMNVSYSTVTLTLQDWHASEYTDIFAQAEVNFDEKRELARAIANAIGRRSDQMIIDALDASGTANTIADGGTNMTFDKLREVIKFFSDNNVPMGDRHIVLSAEAEASLLSSTNLTSTDFVVRKAVQEGSFDGLNLMGMNFRVIGSMSEGGLPLAGNIRTCFAYDRRSMGMGIGIDFRTEINYIAEKTSWLTSGLYKANAVAVDNVGIISIDIDETA